MKERVLVGWPDNGNVYGGFTKSMLSMQHFELTNPSERYEFLEPIRSSGLYVTENRNELIRQAQEMKADWLLQIDGDETFNPDMCRIIMRTADKDTRPVVVGIYSNIGFMDNAGFNVVDCIYAEGKDGQYRNLKPPENLQPFAVDAAGTGVFLVHMSVYEKIASPWFWLEMIQLPDGKVKFMNEDIAFCRIMREAGYKIYCDPMAEAVHWKTLPLVASTLGKFITNSVKESERLRSSLVPSK
jgi:hypothetical protein